MGFESLLKPGDPHLVGHVPMHAAVLTPMSGACAQDGNALRAEATAEGGSFEIEWADTLAESQLRGADSHDADHVREEVEVLRPLADDAPAVRGALDAQEHEARQPPSRSVMVKQHVDTKARAATRVA